MKTDKMVRDNDDAAIQRAEDDMTQIKLNTHNNQLKETLREAKIHKMIKDTQKKAWQTHCAQQKYHLRHLL
jgi:hypothetical protein